MAVTRRRDIPTKTGSGQVNTFRHFKPSGPNTYSVSGPSLFPNNLPNGTQVTVSENHPEWNSRKRGSVSDIGGNFSTEKTTVSWGNPRNGSSAVAESDIVRDEYTYSGPILAVGSGVTFPPSLVSSDATLDAWGAKAIANAKPTNALVDLSATLGEMLFTGGIPRLASHLVKNWEDSIGAALKSGADDYLNFQFGLKPIVQDIVGFANTVTRFNALIRQYERDAGKVVRRGWSFEPISTTANSVWATGVRPAYRPTHSGIMPGVLGQVVRSRKITVRRWFSGAFTYHLPLGYYSKGDGERFGIMAQKLLGTSPTPETLWNLAPWSWAIDWFSSAGDVVSNISDWSSDGLVMRYGYLMEHTLSTDTYSWVDTSAVKASGPPSPVILTRERKVRRRANPFGFGLTWGGLSPRQVAIAASLGITKWG